MQPFLRLAYDTSCAILPTLSTTLSGTNFMDMADIVDSSEEVSKEEVSYKDDKWRRLLTKLPWFWSRDDIEIHDHIGVERVEDVDFDREEMEQRMIERVDSRGFHFKVFMVAASGFLASSYALFATNVILPALYYIYPPCGRLDSNAGVVIDEVTLIGTALGMLLGGHLADLWGRKRLYGLELVILIVANFGVIMSSEGYMIQNSDGDGSYRSTMDVYGWITACRFILGVGIGAEASTFGTLGSYYCKFKLTFKQQYPLTGTIAAEWSPTASRGTMLAAVFAMQAVARLLAFAVHLGILHNISIRNGLSPDAQNESLSKLVVDQDWRWVVAVGLAPAVIAVALRLTIPETPRYYANIRKDLPRAIQTAIKLNGCNEQLPDLSILPPLQDTTNKTDEDWTDWYRRAWAYLRDTETTKAGRNLIVISLLWAIMDSGWYGLSLDSPSTLSTLWHDPSPSTNSNIITRDVRSPVDTCPEYNKWRTDFDSPNITIYQVLQENAIRSLYVVSIGSILGNIALVIIINRFRRKRILTVTFCLLSIIFLILGASLLITFRAQPPKPHNITKIFFGIIQFVFNIGPKTLILVLAAEIFPTVYRGSFFGVAAFTGKIGAISIRAIIGRTGNEESALGIRLLCFIPVMLIGALLSCYLPDVQHVLRVADAVQEEQRQALQEDARPPLGGHRHTDIGDEGQAVVNAADRIAAPSDFPIPERTSRGVQHQKPLRWFEELENKKLEEIAPNPGSNFG